MPSILLINDNKIISRLLQLSSQKQNYKLEEINDYTASKDAYNVIFIDSEKYDEDAWEALKSTLMYDRLGYIGDKSHPKPDGFDMVLEKPFLPTDFVALMSQNFKVISPLEMEKELDAMETVESESALDLDSLDEIELEETFEDLDNLELGDEILPEQHYSMPSAKTTLKTGIAEVIAQEGSKEELADIMSEIEEMEEVDAFEEMDLDALGDEEETVVKEAIVDETMVKESLKEVQAEIDEEIQEEPPVALAVAAGAAATIASVASEPDVEMDDDEVEIEVKDETLNILDGIEAIEKEDDYLKEDDNKISALASEFDSLNEEEVRSIMMNNTPAVEEIISEKIESDGEERVVESGDLEEMIMRAVSKAITKEMLQEVLHDMEITLTLKTKKSE